MALESTVGAEHLAANQSYAQRDAQYKLNGGYVEFVVPRLIKIIKAFAQQAEAFLKERGLLPSFRRRPESMQVGPVNLHLG